MSLTFGLSSASDLFGKLRRDAAALEEEVTSDRFFNFVVTGYSLIDWVFHDPTTPPAARQKADRAQRHSPGSLRAKECLRICGDLANSCKHFKLTYKPTVESAASVQGYGLGRYGKGPYGQGEESITVQLSDGRTYHCLELVKNVIETWQRFFESHGMKV